MLDNNQCSPLLYGEEYSCVFDVLSQKRVTELYHANSVATACQFVRSRSLMSRGVVERSGLAQTYQKSDDADKRHSVWFDIFLDSVDIHERASNVNKYGPVLFVFDIDVISGNEIGRIWVTKLNPTKWDEKTDQERWFQGKEDLEENFIKEEFDQMIVLRHCGGVLPFNTHLKKIILDRPEREIEDELDVYSMAIGALRLAMQDAGIDVPIERRQCSSQCYCKKTWRCDDDQLSRMFDPKI